MISTTNIVTGIRDVPELWIFERFLNLSEKLSGQEVIMTSPINPTERIPSFTLFCKGGKGYRFRDFSSDLGGDAVDLVMALPGNTSLTKGKAIQLIIQTYRAYLQNNQHDVSVIEPEGKFKVVDQELRRWNSDDKGFWSPYHISSNTLEFFNAAPLKRFIMEKEIKGEVKRIEISRALCYGYFDKRGELYKIYQPRSHPNSPVPKFVKIKSYIQGGDQLKGAGTLLITKSLKDIACIHEMGLPDVELISPDSETDLLPAQYVQETVRKYPRVFSLLDQDTAGRKATIKYQERYQIPPLPFNLGHKDPSDTVKAIGQIKVRNEFLKLLQCAT